MAEHDDTKIIVEYSTKDLFDKIDNMETKLYTVMNNIATNFDHAINGNGSEGLKTRQTKTEQTIKILYWLIGVNTTALFGFAFFVIRSVL